MALRLLLHTVLCRGPNVMKSSKYWSASETPLCNILSFSAWAISENNFADDLSPNGNVRSTKIHAQDNTDHALACVWDANMWPGKHTHACRYALTHINSFGANAILKCIVVAHMAEINTYYMWPDRSWHDRSVINFDMRLSNLFVSYIQIREERIRHIVQYVHQSNTNPYLEYHVCINWCIHLHIHDNNCVFLIHCTQYIDAPPFTIDPRRLCTHHVQRCARLGERPLDSHEGLRFLEKKLPVLVLSTINILAWTMWVKNIFAPFIETKMSALYPWTRKCLPSIHYSLSTNYLAHDRLNKIFCPWKWLKKYSRLTGKSSSPPLKV